MNSSVCEVSLMSQRDVDNFSLNVVGQSEPMQLEWILLPFHQEMWIFLLPTTVCFVAAILVTPPILFSIFSNFSLRQETRFLLIGNALISDLIYLFLYTMSSICNMTSIHVPEHLCALLLFSLAATYGGGVLTAGGMVVDTYLAILWPLHYLTVLPPSRTKKLIILLWFFSCLFAGVLFLVLYFTKKPAPCQYSLCSLPVIFLMTLHGDQAIRLCHIFFIIGFILFFSLILCCYIFLCYKTRERGLWKGASSRASVTFLMHHIILGSYFLPLLLLLAESLLYINQVISLKAGMLITLTICNVLIVLPKGVSPYLYGFRYREIYRSLRLFCKFKRRSLVAPGKTYT
ncbi:probable G-protein coupled receptor 148 [Bufo gargarizans]|uniref:probable G-protein coupled receptor 148 n=1 Tax=Bufo gargarizans TaxID=30331 RepID=UPI001CF5AB81|nr:probable G-protein coupled receptor 148 [Bufo gargarizans]